MQQRADRQRQDAEAEKERERNRITALNEIAYNLQATGNKKLAALGKAAAVAQLTMATLRDAPEAYSRTSAAYQYPLGPILGAVHAGSIVAANAAAVSKFADGGVVRGGVPRMDSVPALLTPGESVNTRHEESSVQKLIRRMEIREQERDAGRDAETAGGRETTVVVKIDPHAAALGIAAEIDGVRGHGFADDG